MEKRVVLFLVLSLSIIFGYDFVLRQLGYSPLTDSPILDQSDDSPSLSGKNGSDGLSISEQVGEDPLLSDEGPQSVSETQTIDEQIETIETPLYQVNVTNRGAQIRNWQLKEYLTQSDDPTPVDLVYSEGQFPGPLSLRVPDEELTRILQQEMYTVQRDFSKLDDTHPVGHLTFTYREPDRGLWVQKELTFHHDTYVVDVVVKSEGFAEDLDVLLGTNFGVVEWGQGFIGLLGPAWKIGDDVEKEAPETEIQRSGEISWAALQDKYFISVFIPDDATGVFAKTETERVVSLGMQFPGSSGMQSRSFRLYAGPKQFDTLKEFQIGLEDTIDFGWFIYGSWTIVKGVAKPLFYVLRFLYDYTHNYGIAIILLTVGIKLLFVPLQYKSYKSMQGMQKIQPKVQEVQNKYKDDRERLNKELMKLYREHKVNPVGGCLPMLLQMPVFVALFNILYMTVDLRQAPFMLWISDMSVPDPFYVLPVLMGVSMVVQQKIMPTTMDPTQAKMMLMLPVFLTFLFLTFPAGLVLYWITNNVLTIAQQFITDRYIFKRKTFSSAATGGQPSETKEAGPGKAQTGDQDSINQIEDRSNEAHRGLESKEDRRQREGEQQRPQVEAVVRDLEQLHEEFRNELAQHQDSTQTLIGKVSALSIEVEELRREATRGDVGPKLKTTQQTFKELNREIQQSYARQKTARKGLSRKVQKTLDKVNHVSHENLEDGLQSQFEEAKERVKAAQKQLTNTLSTQRADLETKLSGVKEALNLTEEAIG